MVINSETRRDQSADSKRLQSAQQLYVCILVHVCLHTYLIHTYPAFWLHKSGVELENPPRYLSTSVPIIPQPHLPYVYSLKYTQRPEIGVRFFFPPLNLELEFCSPSAGVLDVPYRPAGLLCGFQPSALRSSCPVLPGKLHGGPL